jgi:hypothetical protein
MRRSYSGENNPFYGKHHSKETRELLSLKAKQRPQGSFAKTEEHKRKIAIALTGKKHTPEHVEHNRLSHLGQKHTEEWKLRHSQQLKGRKLTAEQRLKLSKALKGIRKRIIPPRTPEWRRKIGEANRRRWVRPGFAERILSRLRSQAKPTKAELLLQDILNTNFPNEWKYVGDGKVLIEKRNPDFINCNGKKLVIELFGEYWHEVSEEIAKLEFYLKYGFRCLVIWQHELKEPKKVIEKVKAFTDGQ